MDKIGDRAIFSPLKVIAHPKGNILHGIKASELTFKGFGEAYITTILPKETKGWKKHLSMHMNLVPIQGEVVFYVHNSQQHITEKFTIGPENYGRLYVPPGLWMAFSCNIETPCLVLNIASIEHNPQEAINEDLSKFPLC